MDIDAEEDDDEGRAKDQLRRRRAMEEMLRGMAACKDRAKVSTSAVSGL
eukprot:gene7970-5234_t